MQVNVEAAEGLLRRLSIEIPASRVDEEVERRLKDMSRRVRMDGFRPGKAPFSVVRRRYHDQVREEVVGEVLGRSYGEAINAESLNPAGRPVIESVNDNPGENLSFVAAVEVYPEFEIGDLSGVSIERPVAEVTDEDIDAMLDNLRQQRGEWKAVRHKARKGERVTIDFEGRIDGELFEGGSGQGMQVVIGEGRMLEDFDKGLEGLKKDEPAEIEVTFPEGYHAEHLRGKTAVFTVTATAIEEKVPAELDEAFAEAFGAESIEALRSDVRANMERELRQAVRRQLKSRVLEALAEVTELDVPNALVDEEARRVRDSFVERQTGGQGDPEQLDPSLFREEAERRVRLGLIVAELVKSRNIEVDPQRLEAFIDDVAAAYDEPEQVKRHYRENQELMMNARTVVIEDQVVDHVLEQAKVSDKPMTFKQVMNPEPEPAAEA
ncbi:MAG: trigger factor [Halothiobacillaceae bacterium]